MFNGPISQILLKLSAQKFNTIICTQDLAKSVNLLPCKTSNTSYNLDSGSKLLRVLDNLITSLLSVYYSFYTVCPITIGGVTEKTAGLSQFRNKVDEKLAGSQL